MRKGWLAVVIVAIMVGVAYLGAQAYSSHVFERELSRTLDTLRADGQWQVARDDVQRGWFHSSGRLLIAPANEDTWRAVLPYTARHGLLSTRVSGTLQLYLSESSGTGERALFGEWLPSAEPRWTATFHTLDRRVEARLDVDAFQLDRAARQLAFNGAWLTLEGHAGDLRLSGLVSPLRLAGPQGEIVTGPLHIESRYQVSGDGRFYHQRNELFLERLEYRGGQRPPLTLVGLRYRGETRLDEQLRLDVSLALEEALVAGQTLLSGSLDMSLGRIDGDALRRVIEQLQAALEAHGGDLATLDPAQRRALIERLEPALLAMLADSPRLTVEGMTLTSPMFGIDVRGHGELVFDGENADALSIEALRDPASQAWRRRLDGTFSLYGVPPLVALQLGLPLSTDTLEVTIDAGEVRVNGRPLSVPFE